MEAVRRFHVGGLVSSVLPNYSVSVDSMSNTRQGWRHWLHQDRHSLSQQHRYEICYYLYFQKRVIFTEYFGFLRHSIPSGCYVDGSAGSRCHLLLRHYVQADTGTHPILPPDLYCINTLHKIKHHFSNGNEGSELRRSGRAVKWPFVAT